MPTPDEILAEMRRKVRSFGIGAGREWELVNHIEAWIAERTAAQEAAARPRRRQAIIHLATSEREEWVEWIEI